MSPSKSRFPTALSRRSMSAALAASGLTLTTLPLGRTARAEVCGEGHPMTFAWIGSDDPGYNVSYVEKYGCTANYTFFGDLGEAMAKLRAGFSADVLTPCSDWVRNFYDADLIAPIDTSRLAYYDELIPALRDLPEATIDGQTYFVPIDWGAVSLIYRRDLAPEYVGDESWGILWDPKYEGRIVYPDAVELAIPIAAIYKGIDPYNMSDDDIATVRAALVEQRPLVRTYSADPTSLQQMLAAGEAVAAPGYGYTAIPLQEQGLDLGFVAPKEGALTWVCGVCLLKAVEDKGPEMVSRAYEVIDGFINAGTGVYEITVWGYGHANAEAYKQVDPAVLEGLNIPQDPTSYLSTSVFQKPLPDLERLTAMWEEVKAGF